MNKHRVRTFVLSAAAAGTLMLGVGTAGATELKDVLKVGTDNNKMAQESQQRINKTVEQTDGIVGKWLDFRSWLNPDLHRIYRAGTTCNTIRRIIYNRGNYEHHRLCCIAPIDYLIPDSIIYWNVGSGTGDYLNTVVHRSYCI